MREGTKFRDLDECLNCGHIFSEHGELGCMAGWKPKGEGRSCNCNLKLVGHDGIS